MDSNAQKKAAIREYKNRKTPRGVFAVRCSATGQLWVGSSLNLDGARNGLWFQLNHGSHRNHALQSAWNGHGEPAFHFEVLEQLDDDVAEFAMRDLLKEKHRAWVAELNAQPV